MKIELLYFDGCPGHQALLPRLEAMLAEQDLAADIELRRIESIGDAVRERFLGSPTLRIDGTDVDPSAATREDYGLKCRLYKTPQGRGTLPAGGWVGDALRRATG